MVHTESCHAESTCHGASAGQGSDTASCHGEAAQQYASRVREQFEVGTSENNKKYKKTQKMRKYRKSPNKNMKSYEFLADVGFYAVRPMISSILRLFQVSGLRRGKNRRSYMQFWTR